MVLKKRDKTNKRWGLKIVPSKRAGKKLLVVALLGVVGFAVCSEPRVQADAINTTDFVTTWKTDNPGNGNNSSIAIPTAGGGYNYSVDWNNDGTYDQTGITGGTSHDFGTPGIYTIRIRGDFPRINFDAPAGNPEKILDVAQWGDIEWTSMQGAFRYASNLQVSASDVPDLSNVTNMSNMFGGATTFNSDISGWDVSNVTDMSGMFGGASSFNSDISGWDVSSVTDMYAMFYGSTTFDQSLAQWDMSQVTNAHQMLKFSGMSRTHYDETLVGWAQQTLQVGAGLESDLSYGCEGYTARLHIINTFGWDLIGDNGYDGECAIEFSSDVIEDSSPVDTKAGTLSVVGDFFLRESNPYEIACGTPGPDDSRFTIGGDNGDELRTSEVLRYGDREDGEYDVCVRATSEDGNTLERQIVVSVTPPVASKELTGVTFGEQDGKKLLNIGGSGFYTDDESQSGEFLTRSFVRLNGVDLPFCAAGTGFSAAELQDFGYAMASDDPPCYFYFFDGQNVITPTSFKVWLPNSFNTSDEGTVSVNGSNTYTFNPGAGGDDETPTAVVNDNSLTGILTIPKRPTFSGTAEPGAQIVVTVHSDPVTCSTTADGAGNWSCTLASNLPPGVHTVFVRITNPDASVVNLGPYSVRVGGTVTNDTPLAPDSGVQPIREDGRNLLVSFAAFVIIATVVYTLFRVIKKVTHSR